MMNYYIPDPKSDNEKEPKFIKKSEIYECCENQLLLKTLTGIRKRIID
jgi:hypothetical protein